MANKTVHSNEFVVIKSVFLSLYLFRIHSYFFSGGLFFDKIFIRIVVCLDFASGFFSLQFSILVALCSLEKILYISFLCAA